MNPLKRIPSRFVLGLLSFLLMMSLFGWLGSTRADHTPEPVSVTIAGSLQSELGCAGDWEADCSATHLIFDNDDALWQGTFNVPAGSWEYKAALNDAWDENYGANAVLNGANILLNLGADTDVKFYYRHETHWITDNQNAVIATVPGSFQAALGCPGDWQPDCLRSWLEDPDGDGLYDFSTAVIPAGNYEAKVAHDESWDENYGVGGVQNGDNIPFTVAEGETVTFGYDPVTHLLTITTEPTPTPGPDSVTIAGSLQEELGCSGDWQPDCEATHLTYDADDDVWQETFSVPAGDWEYKAALDNSWDVNYGANGEFNGPNIPLALIDPADVKFYYDDKSHWVTDNVNSVIATIPGSFQAALGCPGDWQPDCLRSWLQDVDGDGIYQFSTAAIPAGDYEAKVAHNESWDENYGAGGVLGGDNIPFTVPDGAIVDFEYDPVTHILTITIDTGGLEPGDEDLVRPPVRVAAANEIFYFVLPDRFDNGDPGNDVGDDPGGSTDTDVLRHGFLPPDKGYYHGGDIAGLQAKLDYLQELGVTAIWMTPQFKNRTVQGDGTIAGSSAAYHGYWQIDYNEIDPHFGTNQEMSDFVAEAHSRGMKVFFDIVINHTGDVVSYDEGTFTYRNKSDYPYRDATGNIFDDEDYAGGIDFPALDPGTSFPYTPIYLTPEDETAKDPDWLNNRIYYHNRGNSTFAGESSLYGDFFGLDDLFTEHPDVVNGMIDIHKDMITEYDIDGFRVDTVKHVNDELWQQFVPEILAHAEALGHPDFYMFGEVFDGNPAFLSRFTTELPFQAVLDFGFHGAALSFASSGNATDNLATFFANDDYFTDDDSNAYGLVKFVGNHDIGRLGFSIDSTNPGAPDSERVARSELAYALAYFSRGVPLIYYGDEQGFVGDGGDKDARQDMLPSQVPSYNDDDLIGTTATTAAANFNTAHPLFQTYSDFSALYSAHLALRQGAQIHRFSEGAAGIYAFSRIERDEGIEYLVALNNSESSDSATFQTDSPDTTFTEIYPGGGPSIIAAADGEVSLTVPSLDVVIYRAESAIATGSLAPGIIISTVADGDEVFGRFELGATLSTPDYAEVTFAVAIDGGEFEPVGTDDNAPYRLFYDAGQLPAGTALSLKAIVRDAAGNLNADRVEVTVGEEEPPPTTSAAYAVIHYFRDDADYGDHTTGDFNDFWGLHLWGEAIDPGEVTDWPNPKPFLGEDEYGRFAWIKLAAGASTSDVNFIIHRGDVKDGTEADRQFNAALTPQIWTRQDDANEYPSQAEAQGYVTVRYHRPDGDYGDPTSPDFNDFWGLHLWGDAIDPSEGTDWTQPKGFDGIDDYGAYYNILIQDASLPVNFIVHRGDQKDPENSPDRFFIPVETATIWLQSEDVEIYESRGAAEDFAIIHYHRPDGDYGDPTSPDFNDFWGMHVWTGALNPNPSWQEPVLPAGEDIFGIFFQVDLEPDATELAYILHRGDEKDPGPDQFLNLDTYGNEVWQPQGADPEAPYILPIIVGPGANPGDINQQRAYWVSEGYIAWEAAEDGSNSFTLHYAPTGGLTADENGISGGDFITMNRDPAGLPPAIRDKFPHLADLPALQINSSDLALVPEILQGQLAVSAVNADGQSVDATGLQIPGVLDDLYSYDGDLGVIWNSGSPTMRVWAPTAQSVTFHLFSDSDPGTSSDTYPMTLDPASGAWTISGEAEWKDQYYLYEVEVYVHSTGQVEQNIVTDPYSFSLAMNSRRSQIVDLNDPLLVPAGWQSLVKPELNAPEDISIYEIHIRDFSVNDFTVPEAYRGTFKAFTLDGTNGMNHLEALQAAGLSHLHLLPVFDIATINENKVEWQEPDPDVLATYPPDSELQQEAVTLVEDLDGFNWGYDPFHYTVPEGSYATNPDGPTRIVEFREMVQSLNGRGLRVVMDVVYNHTNASGQDEKSVLDRIVPGYYHRLNDTGQVEQSTCCENTASEHNMMEKLMVDSLVTWAKYYKIDAFRFDLMGHHMVDNMVAVRAALDNLTLAEDGVDGRAIYIYGEGWNFGEVADGARGENATQLNVGGLGIGTFSDRLRDAVRGGGPFDSGDQLLRQGFANGLYYDPNELEQGDQLATLLLLSDQIRVGMAGNLAAYEFIDRNGNLVTGADVDYNGQPAGYTEDPQEDITYISKHDNQTLYDINVYGAPVETSMADRVRIQNVGLSTVLLGQGVPFMHAGSDLLRSKSLDRDSFNSGDWFNRIDFTYQANNFGAGLPVAGKNQENWPIMQPLLANPALMPAPADIVQTADLFQELLEIRYSSELFRLETAAEIHERVAFHNTGPDQLPGLVVMSLSDEAVIDLDRDIETIVVLVNANHEAQTFAASVFAEQSLLLHPVQVNSVDPVVGMSSYDEASGSFTIPARTTAVFVEYAPAEERIAGLIDDVFTLVDEGVLRLNQAKPLMGKLYGALKQLLNDRPDIAVNRLNSFANQVNAYINAGILTPEQGQPLIDTANSIIRQILADAG